VGDPVEILWKCLMLVKLEWLGYRMVKKLWRYVKPFLSDTGTWRTDRQTDRHICYINIMHQYAGAQRYKQFLQVAWLYRVSGFDLAWFSSLLSECFCVFGLNFPCGRLSWLPVSFLLHVKYSLSYRIISYRINGAIYTPCLKKLCIFVSVTTLSNFYQL